MQSIEQAKELWATASAKRAEYHAARDRFLSCLQGKASDDIQRQMSYEASHAYSDYAKAHNAALGIREIQYFGG